MQLVIRRQRGPWTWTLGRCSAMLEGAVREKAFKSLLGQMTD